VCVEGPAVDGSSALPDRGSEGLDGGGADVADEAMLPEAGSPDGGPSKCPGSFLLCDGMEREGFLPSAWHPYSDPGSLFGSTLLIDTGRAARGNASLRVHVDAGQEVSAGMFWRAGTLDEYFVRFFLFMPNTPPGNGYVSLEDQDSLSANWTESEVSLSGVHPSTPANLELLTSPPAPVAIPRDRWVCVILHVEPRAVSLFIDDETAAALTSPLVQPAKVRDVYFRFYSNRRGSGAPFDMWLDEIAVDQAPIHCAQ
jgi:hypothetical protein